MVWYSDDVFTIHHRWLFEFRRELERRNVHTPFETISRADRMMKEEVLETLAALGCFRVWIGSESGSQRILDRMADFDFIGSAGPWVPPTLQRRVERFKF